MPTIRFASRVVQRVACAANVAELTKSFRRNTACLRQSHQCRCLTDKQQQQRNVEEELMLEAMTERERSLLDPSHT